MMEWKPYLDDRVIAHLCGFAIIKPSDAEPGIPLCCSLCKTMLRDRDDEEAFNDFGCCHFCALTWAHPRRAEWKAGWRPTSGEITSSRALRAPPMLVLDLD